MTVQAMNVMGLKKWHLCFH